ncbi:MAG: translation initiation factor IF-3 [Candidatus Muiribacteriota bacterium]
MKIIKKVNYSVNDEIKASEVRLIGSAGEQVGIVKLSEALNMADEEGLDLVEIAPMAKPPVCKLINFSKFKYELLKKEKEAKKKQKIVEVKEIRLRPNIEEHDLNIKINKAVGFLKKGDKVRFNLRFKGRQNAYKEQGEDLLEKVGEMIQDYGKVEKNINRNKRIFLLEVTPLTEKS